MKKRSKVKQWITLPWLVLITACLLLLVLYLYIKNNYLIATDSIAFFENAEAIESVFNRSQFSNRDESDKPVYIIYFWQAYCSCDNNMLPHFADIVREHNDHSVHFSYADLSDYATAHQAPFDSLGIAPLEAELVEQLRPLVMYTPAVAIFDANGSMNYYGPHSLGEVCNVDTSFISKALDSLLDGVVSRNINTVGEGCFCKVGNANK